MTFIFAAGNN